MSEQRSLGVVAAAKAVHDGDATPTALVADALRAIDGANAELGAFVRVDHDDALEQASRVEWRLASGETLALAGVTIAAKDNVDLAGRETRAGSIVLAGRVPDRDATVVARLRAAGAVIVGSAAMDELALGGTGENPHTGDVRNPVDRHAITGGSSSGSAAAVAAGLVDAALGTDTCGSIRMPAALTGTVGLRPSTGTVPLAGIVPLAPSMDTVGPLARTVEDMAAVWQVLADRHAAPHEPTGTRVLVTGLHDVAPAVAAATAAAEARLAAIGATIATLPDDGWIADSVGVASTTFLREAALLHASAVAAHPERFGTEVLDALRAGAAIDEETWQAAHARRAELTARARAALAPGDVLLLPVFGFAWMRSHADAVETAPGILVDRVPAMLQYVSAAALTGLPALSVPAGVDDTGHPIGVQLIGAPDSEPRLIALARALQAATA